MHFHWALIDALERRDSAAAVAALADDITYSFNLIRARLERDTPVGSR